jgi:hypothetical protein
MIEGIVAANALVGPPADAVRGALWDRAGEGVAPASQDDEVRVA